MHETIVEPTWLYEAAILLDILCMLVPIALLIYSEEAYLVSDTRIHTTEREGCLARD